MFLRMYSFIYRELVVESLTHLFNSVAEKSEACYTIHLLHVLPLIHFLRKDLVPNESVLLTSEWPAWEDPYLNFERVLIVITSVKVVPTLL